jgi:hypothetical protein
MSLDSSLPSSIADENKHYGNKCFPKGIHVIRADEKSARTVEEVSNSDEEKEIPWGYLFIQHFAAEKFEKTLETVKLEGDFKPKCFIHRTINYKRKPNGKGIMKEEKPTISGLVFLQGETDDLKDFLKNNFPQYHLVNNCTTGKPASIQNRIMKPFMDLMKLEPERVTFLRDPFEKFAKDHVKLRILTGIMAGQEGYVVRILRDRQLVMDFGGYAVAIKGVHNEDFEIAE